MYTEQQWSTHRAAAAADVVHRDHSFFSSWLLWWAWYRSRRSLL